MASVASMEECLLTRALAFHPKKFKCGWVWLLQLTRKVKGRNMRIKRKLDPSCPAMCKRSGKCYSIAYFNGKSGKARECIEAQCPRIEKVEEACTSARVNS
jgi:hypothetical protein